MSDVLSQTEHTEAAKPWLWKPGQSANPSGRPKAAAEMVRLAREHTPEAIATIAKIMRDAKAPKAARIAAAGMLLDRGWGKPKEHVTLDGEVELHVVGIDAPPRETREQWIARRERELAALTIEHEPVK